MCSCAGFQAGRGECRRRGWANAGPTPNSQGPRPHPADCRRRCSGNRESCLDAPAADYLVPPQPSRRQRLVYGPSGLAVNEYVVAADLLGERAAGAENHGDALMVGGGWRTKLTRDREEPAASVVQRHLQLGLAAEEVRGQSLRRGAAVTDEAADAGHGE